MILIICQPCALCIRIMGDPEEISHLIGEKSDFWPDKYVCPRCEKSCEGIAEIDVDPSAYLAVELVDVNAQEAFAAMHGMGLPHEGDCRKLVLEGLLKEQPVRKLHGRNIPHTNRCSVDCLELWDGSKLYFAAGAEGAVVYRITRPTSYVEKVDGR
jgi:hypothetical protein